MFHSTCRYKIEPPGFWRTAVLDLIAKFAYNAIMTQFWPGCLVGRLRAFHKLVPSASSPLTYSGKKGLNRTVTLSLLLKKKISIIRRRFFVGHFFFIIVFFLKSTEGTFCRLWFYSTSSPGLGTRLGFIAGKRFEFIDIIETTFK